MQYLILIRGLPGSGKTTLAKDTCRDDNNCDHFEADDYFTDKMTGEYRYDASKLKEAHDLCYMNASKSLQAGRNVVVANTFTRFWEMRRYYDLAATRGCNVHVIICRGNYQNVHNVPDDVIEHMRQRWEE